MALPTKIPKKGLKRFDFLDEFEEMRREMEDVFHDIERRLPRLAPTREGRWMPFVDMFERKGKLVVKAEMPGLDPKDVKVYMTDHMLVIESERREEEKIEDEEYYRHEILRGKFLRRIELPEGIEPEEIAASYRNGILEVRLPKGVETKPKEIPVEVD